MPASVTPRRPRHALLACHAARSANDHVARSPRSPASLLPGAVGAPLLLQLTSHLPRCACTHWRARYAARAAPTCATTASPLLPTPAMMQVRVCPTVCLRQNALITHQFFVRGKLIIGLGLVLAYTYLTSASAPALLVASFLPLHNSVFGISGTRLVYFTADNAELAKLVWT
jgi:hypothetical protein